MPPDSLAPNTYEVAKRMKRVLEGAGLDVDQELSRDMRGTMRELTTLEGGLCAGILQFLVLQSEGILPAEIANGMAHLTNPNDTNFADDLKDPSVLPDMLRATALVLKLHASECYQKEYTMLRHGAGGRSGSTQKLADIVGPLDYLQVPMEPEQLFTVHSSDDRWGIWTLPLAATCATIRQSLEAMPVGSQRQFDLSDPATPETGSHRVAVKRRADGTYRVLDSNDPYMSCSSGPPITTVYIIIEAMLRTADPSLRGMSVADLKNFYLDHRVLGKQQTVNEIFGSPERPKTMPAVFASLENRRANRGGLRGGSSAAALAESALRIPPLRVSSRWIACTPRDAAGLLVAAVGAACDGAPLLHVRHPQPLSPSQ